MVDSARQMALTDYEELLGPDKPIKLIHPGEQLRVLLHKQRLDLESLCQFQQALCLILIEGIFIFQGQIHEFVYHRNRFVDLSHKLLRDE